MIELSTLRSQTLALRSAFVKKSATMADSADVIPAGWNNHLRWHVGHLVLVPRLLTLGLAGRPIGVPEEYRSWFAKGTMPRSWGDAPVPPLDQLLGESTGLMEELFDELATMDLNAPFATPYPTSAGVPLNNPAEALLFSFAHDGIHVGLLFALARALQK